MESVFLVQLHNLEITGDLGLGDRISDSMRITNNRGEIAKHITGDVRTIIGDMEAAALLSGGPVVIAKTEIPPNLTPSQYLIALLYQVQAFQMTTWSYQDNSINCEMGFLIYSEGLRVNVSSNFLAHLYTSSRGETVLTRLSREELRRIRKLHREAISPPELIFAPPLSQLTSTYQRIARAAYMLNGARGQSDIAMKVAHYCSAFETLFSTNQAELSHQLSERIACFLHKSTEQRLDRYRKTKAAYGLRSKVVHGSTIRPEKIAEAVEISEYCDQTAREIFHRVLTETSVKELFEKGAQSFDEEMLRVIFSGE